MQVINKYICKDVCGIIDEYLHGDKNYWKNKYIDILISLTVRREEFMIVDVKSRENQPLWNQHHLKFMLRKIKQADTLCYRGIQFIAKERSKILFIFDFKLDGVPTEKDYPQELFS